MPATSDKRAQFRRLHESGCFVIPNPWDVGSARYLASLGFKALATTSAGAAWAMDYADGELRFQIYHCFGEGSFDQQVVRRLLGTAIHTFDRYFPAFMSIIYGNEVVKDAIEHVEKMTL